MESPTSCVRGCLTPRMGSSLPPFLFLPANPPSSFFFTLFSSAFSNEEQPPTDSSPSLSLCFTNDAFSYRIHVCDICGMAATAQLKKQMYECVRHPFFHHHHHHHPHVHYLSFTTCVSRMAPTCYEKAPYLAVRLGLVLSSKVSSSYISRGYLLCLCSFLGGFCRVTAETRPMSLRCTSHTRPSCCSKSFKL